MIRYVSTERGRRLPCRRVATHAVRGVQRVIVVDVARRARSWRRRHVRPRQRKTCNAVVERSPVPSLRRVAVRTVRQRKCWTSRRVHRIVRLLPGREVAPGCPARSGCDVQAVVVVDVARRARRRRRRHVRPGQRKSCNAVIERSRVPTFRRVAVRAVRQRKSRA